MSKNKKEFLLVLWLLIVTALCLANVDLMSRQAKSIEGVVDILQVQSSIDTNQNEWINGLAEVDTAIINHLVYGAYLDTQRGESF